MTKDKERDQLNQEKEREQLTRPDMGRQEDPSPFKAPLQQVEQSEQEEAEDDADQEQQRKEALTERD